jgi:membrane-bound inhibitor of C-type lysozyme
MRSCSVCWPLLGALLLLAGCAGQRAEESVNSMEVSRTLVYECDQDEVVASARGKQLTLYVQERTYQLTRVVSASGEKYEVGATSFWSKGNSALITVGGSRYTNCRLDRARAPWEEARRRGVEFRGVGQEPGWLVEITPGGQILLVTGYGQQRWLFDTPDPVQTADATVYQTSANGKVLKITLQTDYCQDTMSGEVFENVVTVELDERRLQGCGSALEPDWHWQ